MSKILAQYILDVAKAHEAAYDKVASDRASVLAAEKEAKHMMPVYVNYAQFQTKTLHQCAEEIVPVLYRQPVYLLLQTAWNDALEWAVSAMALRSADGDDQHDFRFLIPSAAKDGSSIDFQLSAQNELCAAFKLGQIFNENLSIETVKLHMMPNDD